MNELSIRQSERAKDKQGSKDRKDQNKVWAGGQQITDCQ
jgi:hypothetical protein